MSAVIVGDRLYGDDHPCCVGRSVGVCFFQAEQSIVEKSLAASIPALYSVLCVCVCSRGCGFVSKHDRRGYFRFVPMQLTEGRSFAEQLGITRRTFITNDSNPTLLTQSRSRRWWRADEKH